MGPFTTPRRAAAISEINEASRLRPGSSIQMPTYCLPSGFTELHTWFSTGCPFIHGEDLSPVKPDASAVSAPYWCGGGGVFMNMTVSSKRRETLGVEEAPHLQCNPAGVRGCPGPWGAPSQREPFSGSCYPSPYSLLLQFCSRCFVLSNFSSFLSRPCSAFRAS